MIQPHISIASYLRERREAARLTRAELARRAGVSEGLIQKLEQGVRPPTAIALGALFDALSVPDVFREYAILVLEPKLTTGMSTEFVPSQAELDFLHSIPYPACYQTSPALDLIAANSAFLEVFPGLRPDGNILAWLLLDPRSRKVIQNWEREAHIVVQAFRYMAPGTTAPDRIEAIKRMCQESPDWHRLWATDIPPAQFEWQPMCIRPLEGTEWTAMHVQILRPEMPRRGWWMYSLVPIPGGA